jgi:hypothetical protein
MVNRTPDVSRVSAYDLERVARAAGSRSFGLALASDLRYVRAPAISGNVLHAVLGKAVEGKHDPREDFHVAIALENTRGALVGECSRCRQLFGPCPHLALLALDIAVSAPLRERLFEGGDTTAAAVGVPALRALLHAERGFDRALAAWLSPTTDGQPIEIAASPSTEADGYGRPYEESFEAPSPTLAITVRHTGERKLLAATEIAPPVRFGARDRRVLEHARSRGSGRKAVYATSVKASLALEAMRLHGGVYAHGYKTRLDFRSGLVRPTLTLASRDPSSANEAPLETLSATWASDDGATRIAFADAVFFPGPFSYVWTRGGVLYRVAPDVDVDFARELARAPALLVPRARLRDAGARLLRAARGRGVAMPPNEAFGLPPMETPRVVLRLTGEPLDVVGELVAV